VKARAPAVLVTACLTLIAAASSGGPGLGLPAGRGLRRARVSLLVGQLAPQRRGKACGRWKHVLEHHLPVRWLRADRASGDLGRIVVRLGEVGQERADGVGSARPPRRRELARRPSGCSIRGPVQPPRGAASRHPAPRDRLSDDRLRHGRHAATGKHLVEAPVGLYVGRKLDPLLDRGWAQVRYAYSFVENIKDHDTGDVLNLNRSNLDAEIGYYLSTSFSVRVLGAFQWTYGGFDVGIYPLSDADFEDHDRRVRANFQKLGLGTTYSKGRSTSRSSVPSPWAARIT